LCERHDAWLVVDDAHGFGVLGQTGSGSLAHWALSSERIVYIGTLGKAAGVFGAFVAADADVVEVNSSARSHLHVHDGQPAAARRRPAGRVGCDRIRVVATSGILRT